MSFHRFKDLHQEDGLLILGNVWDAQSAKIAEEAGFKALGTSSHAIANAMGYEDGQNITVEEILFVVERIIKKVNIPVSVDFEAGYSDNPQVVAQNVKRLSDIGVVGINLEDGIVLNGKRQLADALQHAEKIKAIKEIVKDIFINARTDTYTTKAENTLEETIKRAKLYAEAGADGFFVPLIEKKEDIKHVTTSIALPLNVFLTPNLPDLDMLQQLGVKRLSHGAKIFEWLTQKNEEAFKKFIQKPILPE